MFLRARAREHIFFARAQISVRIALLGADEGASEHVEARPLPGDSLKWRVCVRAKACGARGVFLCWTEGKERYEASPRLLFLHLEASLEMENAFEIRFALFETK